MKNLIAITLTLVKMKWKKTLPKTTAPWQLSRRNFRGEKLPMTEWAWISPARSVYPDALNIINSTGVWDAGKLKYVDVNGQPLTGSGWNNS